MSRLSGEITLYDDIDWVRLPLCPVCEAYVEKYEVQHVNASTSQYGLGQTMVFTCGAAFHRERIKCRDHFPNGSKSVGEEGAYALDPLATPFQYRVGYTWTQSSPCRNAEEVVRRLRTAAKDEDARKEHTEEINDAGLGDPNDPEFTPPAPPEGPPIKMIKEGDTKPFPVPHPGT